MFKHSKCNYTLLIPAQADKLLFICQLTLNKGAFVVNPSQLLGDNIEFALVKSFYCSKCKKNIPFNSDEVVVGTCLACKQNVAPNGLSISYKNTVSVAHEECLKKVIEEYLKKFEIEEYKVEPIKIEIKEL